ncbi:MAG TPA: adenylate/guanylate cyclase domain-containing protein [Anaerolineae bacterium]|nr:adenylate/guanylate cyclase domain-containing protein [Anaerolineae bacterium]
MDKKQQLQQAITIQESLRGTVPDDIIDAAITAIQAQLNELTLPTTEPQRQRKQVTILFADLTGFTAMSEKLDAEDVSDTMNALWQRLDKTILEWNGHIDKHIGDAVMALWGMTEAREDDPKLAIHAALAIQTAVHTFNQEKNLTLTLRIGLNTGPVLLGEVGTVGEFTAMGDTVNVAARLETAAQPGQILISHNTYHHVRGLFNLTHLPPITVKGKSAPLPIYAVNGVKPRAFRLRTRGVEGIQTRMIGRQTEMRQLQKSWQTLQTNPQTTLMTIVGDAGVGKSRLLYEFENWLDLRPDQVHLLKGRTAERAASTPYFLLRDLLASRFGIQESDNIQRLRHKFNQEIAPYFPHNSTAQTTILGQWLGYNFTDHPQLQPLINDPQQLNNRGRSYFLELLTNMAQEKTVVIFLEDIHWADHPSLNALQLLFQRHPNLPIFCLALTRPAFFQNHPDWKTNNQILELYPLPAASDHELLREILQKMPQIPPELFQLLAHRAEGNPFYMEEMIKMLIDNGTITTHDDAWQIDMNKLNTHAIPSTLTGVIQARLDQLTPPERKMLQAASVIGRIFWDKALQQLLPHEEIHLTPLQNKEVIFPHTDNTFPHTREFIFKHDLLRDVVYHTVLKQTRHLYHEQTANWLANISQNHGRLDEYAPIIAEHYAQAENSQQAHQWYYRAGQQAYNRYAHDEALRCYNLALDHTPHYDHDQQYDILIDRERIYHLRGQRDSQLTDLQALTTLAQQLNDPHRIIPVQLRHAQYAEVTSDYDTAIHHAQQAIQLAQTHQLPHLEAKAHLSLGQSVLAYKHSIEAAPHFETAITLAQQTNQEEMLADCYLMLGVTRYFAGDYHGAQNYHEKSIAVARRYKNRPIEGGAFNNLGFWAYKHGDYDKAIEYLTGYLPTTREINHRQMESILLNNLGHIFLAQQQIDKAYQHYHQAIHITQEIDDTSNEAISLIGLGRTLIHQHKLDEAITTLQQAINLHHQIGQKPFIMEATTQLGWAHLQNNDPQTAHNTIQPVIDYLQQGGHFDHVEYGLANNLICYHILSATADPYAPQLLTNAYHHLIQFTQQFHDADVRHKLLNNVPWHRQLITLFETI